MKESRGESPTSTSAAPNRKNPYRPEIDGLRALAVTAVIINHFNKDLLPSGYLGVDIFFVISGYVITSSLANRQSRSFRDFITGFYERRIKRLVPALAAFVLATSILISLVNPDPGSALKTGIFSLFGISNLSLFQQSVNYFAESTELNPFTHTWSLGVEEQFYLLFPFLIWFSGFGRQAQNGARNLFFWTGALTMVSLASFIFLYQTNQPAAYFLMPPRFWEMAAGCLVFIGFQKRAKIEQTLEKVPPLLVVAAMFVVMFLPTSWAVPATILIVVLSTILLACLKYGTAAFSIFTNKRVVKIGVISYSLYLWHWGVLSLSRWSIGIHWWSAPLQVALMLLLANLSYSRIEQPLRKQQFKHSFFPFLFGALTIGATTLVLSVIAIYQQKFATGFVLTKNANLTSTWWRDKNHNYIEHCHAKKRYSDLLLKECLGQEAKPTSKPVGYLIGDSHARNYLVAARKAFPEMQVRYLTMGDGCTFLPEALINKKLDSKVDCTKYTKDTAKYILASAKVGDIVFVGQSLLDYFYSERTNPVYFEHLRAFANSLANKHVPVVLFDGTFPAGNPPELCSKELWRPFPDKANCQKTTAEAKQAYSTFDAMAEQLSRTANNVFYAPLRLGLCLNGICGQESRLGTPIWHDIGHITEAASGELSGLLRSELSAAGLFTYMDAGKHRR